MGQKVLRSSGFVGHKRSHKKGQIAGDHPGRPTQVSSIFPPGLAVKAQARHPNGPGVRGGGEGARGGWWVMAAPALLDPTLKG
jgi:hypothetical protein